MVKIKSNQRTQADIILDYLEELGVEYIFGVPGGAIEPLYNALARREAAGKRPKSIVARHESGAAFMADGYARVTGKLGVCCATTGPGTTNLITGIASAFADHTPLLVITPQTALPTFGQKGLQESSCDEINTTSMMDYCTVYSSFVSHIDQLERKLYHAIIEATQPRRGPAHLSIPMDIMAMPAYNPPQYQHIGNRTKASKAVDNSALEKLCNKMLNANKAIIFIGLGARYATDAILKFAEIILADIVTAPEAKGFIPTRHHLNKGVFGFAGHDSARKTLTDSDISIILAIGTGFDELSTAGWDKKALLNVRLVHIDDHLENFTYSPFANLHVHGNIQSVFEILFQRATKSIEEGRRCPILNFDQNKKKTLSRTILNLLRKDEITAYNDESIPIKPQRMMHCLNELMPDSTHFVIDAGNIWAWATHYLNIQESHQYHIGMGFGTMAWGIGTATGIAIALKNTPVCCITGDGSYLMSSHEITVAVQHKVPLIIVLINDACLGMVKHGQAIGGGEEIGYQLPIINYAEIARQLGAQAFTIESGSDLQKLDMLQICQYKGPTLIDVHIDPDEIPPMGARMKVLNHDEST